MPAAVISTAGGVGDLVRITPLVGVCHGLGFEVDLVVEADYADAAALVRGVAGVRRVFRNRSRWTGAGPIELPADDERYEVAIFTAFTEPVPWIRAERSLMFERWQWLQEGDLACIRRIASELGWTAPLPAPRITPSARRFGLASGTVALHPGCKPNWPWKKWHGFAELAARLPRVVLVGTPADLQNGGTYFGTSFTWPLHVRSFIGQLDLADTAALLAECAAVVSNDSGLMHVAAALGVPTFGIFGITSPDREAMPMANMRPLTKGLPCESDCRRAPWGRSDCARHLECLRSLSTEEVLAVLVQTLPHTVADIAASVR